MRKTKIRILSVFLVTLPVLLTAAVVLAEAEPAAPAVTMPDPNVGAAPTAGEWKKVERSLPAEGLISIPVPNVSFTDIIFKEETRGDQASKTLDIPWLAQYIVGVYKYAVGIAGVLAAVMMMIGGIQYLTAGGDAGRVSKGKEKISDALLGLFLVLGTYMILNVINPDLTKLQGLRVESIARIDFVPNETPEIAYGPGTPATGGTNGVPHLNQFSYGNVPYINSKPQAECVTGPPPKNKPYTVKSSGCGITSAAMVISKYQGGVGTAEPTLRELVQLVRETPGARSCNPPRCSDCNGTSFAALAPAIKEKYGMNYRILRGNDQAGIMQLLRDGKPVIANMGQGLFTSGGHYVVLTGVNPDGTIAVNDPAGSQTSNYTCMPRWTEGCTPVNISRAAVPPEYIFGGAMRNATVFTP